MLLCLGRRQDFFPFLRILFLLSIAQSVSFCRPLGCVLSPSTSSSLQLSCPVGAFSTSSPSAGERRCFRYSFTTRRREGPHPARHLHKVSCLSLLPVAPATCVKEGSVRSFRSSEPGPVLDSASRSRGITHELPAVATFAGPATASTPPVYCPARGRQQLPRPVVCLEHALFTLSSWPVPKKGGTSFSSVPAGAVSTINVFPRRGVVAGEGSRQPAVTSSHNACAGLPRQGGLAFSFSASTVKQWAAPRRYGAPKMLQNSMREVSKMMRPALASPAGARPAAFLFSGRATRCLLPAPNTFTHGTRHCVPHSTCFEFRTASYACNGVFSSAISNSRAFCASATPLQWNAFVAAAPSHCGKCTARRAILALTSRSLPTAKCSLSTQTSLGHKYTNTSSFFAPQQQYHHEQHQHHRWTSLLSAHQPAQTSYRHGNLTHLPQQIQQLSFSSPLYCCRVASHHGRVPSMKQISTAAHTIAEAAIVNTPGLSKAPHKENTTDTTLHGSSPDGLRSCPGACTTETPGAYNNTGDIAANDTDGRQALHLQRSDWRHARRFTHTKQIATIGPASWTYEEIERLFLSGVDVFRLNLSHGLLHEKHQQLQHVRSVEKKYGHPIAVLADLPGPKLRLGSFKGDDSIFLPTGTTFIIDNASAVVGNQERVALPQNEEVLQVLQSGDVLLLDDGKLKLQVIRQVSCSKENYQQLLRQRGKSREKEERHVEESQQQRGEQQQQVQEYGKHEELRNHRQHARSEEQHMQSLSAFPDHIIGVECIVLVGGTLSGKKGVNIPSATLPISALSARDRELARLVAGWGVDWIALSFVQRAEDVRELRRELRAQAQLLASDASDNTKASQSSSRIFRPASDGRTSMGTPNKVSGTGEQLEYNAGQSTSPLLVHTQQPKGKQQEIENQETEMEEQRRLRLSMKAHEESFSSFAPSHVRRGGEIAVIVKVEKPLALENIEEILEEADALMVARGDLGVELAEHAAWLPVVQKRLVKLCQDAGKPVVIATQMLDSMTHAPAPTRAELTDVANAVYDGADAVMLSGETAAGAAPAHVAQTQYEGIQAVESDPHFWRQQSDTRRRLVDKKAARAASCFAAEVRSSAGEFSPIAGLDTDARGGATRSRDAVEREEEQCNATDRAAAAGSGEAPVAALRYTHAALTVEEAAGGLRQQVRTAGLEEVHQRKGEQAELAVHAQQKFEQSAGFEVEHSGVDSSFYAARQRLFPEFRDRLPWKRRETRIPQLPLRGHEAGDHAAAARRAAAALAATSFYERDPEIQSGYGSYTSKGSRTRGSRCRTDVHPQEDKGMSATTAKNHTKAGSAGWVAAAAEQASRLSGATNIVVFEETGDIARHLAALRPAVPILAVTPSAYVARELQLHWGVYPVVDTSMWKAEKDVLDKPYEGGERAAAQEQTETKREEGRGSETFSGARTQNDSWNAVKPGRVGETGEGLESESGRVSLQAKDETRICISVELPFSTQVSKAVALLVDEGMVGVDRDEKVVVVGGFHTRMHGTAKRSDPIEQATIFLPQISVSHIRAFL